MQGMFVAAVYLGDDEARAQALAYVQSVSQAIESGQFRSDQEPLDPKNPVRPVAGRHSHGPFMIQLGAAAALVRAAVSDGRACRVCARLACRTCFRGCSSWCLPGGDVWP
jgi:hypothetical protein